MPDQTLHLGADTAQHRTIYEAISDGLLKSGLVALRSDSKEYSENLLLNVLTYMWGCWKGVAVFERIESDGPNPNVAFEFGYMKALRKRVLLLKDKNLPNLQTDLIGVLYKQFDPQEAASSIPPQLTHWLADL